MEYKIRKLTEEEYDLLKDFLYEAIFIPKGVLPPPKEIIQKPELQVYYKDFGSRKGDAAVAAETGGRIVGAAWARIMDDYGHIDGHTPSLAISLFREFRNRGIGSALLKELLGLLRGQGYARVSLSVQKENYAVRMYRKAGFETVSENDEEYIMVCRL